LEMDIAECQFCLILHVALVTLTAGRKIVVPDLSYFYRSIYLLEQFRHCCESCSNSLHLSLVAVSMDSEPR